MSGRDVSPATAAYDRVCGERILYADVRNARGHPHPGMLELGVHPEGHWHLAADGSYVRSPRGGGHRLHSCGRSSAARRYWEASRE